MRGDLTVDDEKSCMTIRTVNCMGILVYSLLRLMQDLYPQP